MAKRTKTGARIATPVLSQCPGCRKGFHDYINKRAFLNGHETVDRRFPIDREDKEFEGIIERANALYGALMAEALPSKEECWKCGGYCSHSLECVENVSRSTPARNGIEWY